MTGIPSSARALRRSSLKMAAESMDGIISLAFNRNMVPCGKGRQKSRNVSRMKRIVE